MGAGVSREVGVMKNGAHERQAAPTVVARSPGRFSGGTTKQSRFRIRERNVAGGDDRHARKHGGVCRTLNGFLHTRIGMMINGKPR
jgi:hypothetical protein